MSVGVWFWGVGACLLDGLATTGGARVGSGGGGALGVGALALGGGGAAWGGAAADGAVVVVFGGWEGCFLLMGAGA
jgi:hypothetical protein